MPGHMHILHVLPRCDRLVRQYGSAQLVSGRERLQTRQHQRARRARWLHPTPQTIRQVLGGAFIG